MRKILLMFAVLAAMVFSGCSKDDTHINETPKYKIITVTEYEWKFGEKSEHGELYEKLVYDTIGNLLRKETYYYIAAIQQRLPQYYLYWYDLQNRLIKEEVGELWSKSYIYKYTYNEIDSIATKQIYNKDGKLTEEWEYTYDNQRRLKQAKCTHRTLSQLTYIYDYSYNGNTITEVWTSNGKLSSTTISEYDNHGNLIKQTRTDGATGKTDVHEYEYTYNSLGQIARKTSPDYYIKSYLTYRDYTYNEDGTIQSIHISYSWKADQSDLEYSYSYE